MRHQNRTSHQPHEKTDRSELQRRDYLGKCCELQIVHHCGTGLEFATNRYTNRIGTEHDDTGATEPREMIVSEADENVW